VSAFAAARSGHGGHRGAPRRVIFSPFDVSLQVDREHARERLVQELCCPKDVLLVGFVGSFVERKRPLIFLEVVAQLRQLLPTRAVMGIMLGEARHSEMHARMVARMAEPDLVGAARVLGFRAPGHEWIAGLDALLVPAVDEPLGRTLVEAMLVGTPVIAANSGGTPEALDNSWSFLCPPDDIQAMAAAIVSCLADPVRMQAMTDLASVLTRERFSQVKHCREVMEVYAELTG